MITSVDQNILVILSNIITIKTMFDIPIKSIIKIDDNTNRIRLIEIVSYQNILHRELRSQKRLYQYFWINLYLIYNEFFQDCAQIS